MSDAAQSADVPVLTQVVEELHPGPAPAADAAALEALARQIEQTLLERLAPQIERMAAQAVRDAVAESLAQALGAARRD